MSFFQRGAQYSRADIGNLIGMPRARQGGAWDTGYDEWNGEIFIFANVGIAGRTGHDYANRWVDQKLVWYGKTNAHRGQPQIDRIIANDQTVHVFWRGADRSSFTYAGVGTATAASSDKPVQVTWSFDGRGVPPTRPEAAAWRRGPAPFVGRVDVSRSEGPTAVYVMEWVGPISSLIDLPKDHTVIKVGMSNDVSRRLDEMNIGFPPGSKVVWALATSTTLPDGKAAFEAKSMCLELLRRDGQWIGGEFAVVPSSAVHNVLKALVFGESDLAPLAV